jgi:NAD(P)-dependent dehydrogenase (short-subunit alcohol dehydrogenase family)
MHVINAFLPLLRTGTTKRIVAISSAAGDLDFVLRSREALLASYAASKAALNVVIAKYAVNLASEGFICVSLNPGMVDTEQTSVPAHRICP